jgi:YebC/PmpR family DNA-binding regulatory protein
MAGHNKWSKIKHKKGATDAKRSKVWTKIIREVSVAARMGGPDPMANPRLRKAVDDAKAANMPKENIQRAIAKASGAEGDNLEELVYEGYGPGGVAIVVECMTDNRNRTGSDVRSAMNKKGGNLGSPGSVLFSFKKKGQIIFDKEPKEGKVANEDSLLEIGMEHGAEDVSEENDCFLVTCEPEKFLLLKDAFESAELIPSSSELCMVPDNLVKISGDSAKTLLSLIEGLEDLDDVQNVWSNMDIDDEELERLMG